MAFFKSVCKGLITVFAFVVIHGSETSDFPLADCFNDDLDILSLISVTYSLNVKEYQIRLQYEFIKNCLDLSGESTQRVKSAMVFDKYSVNNLTVIVSSWSFDDAPTPDVYGFDDGQVMKTSKNHVQHVLETKIAFVDRLFSEMSGVRDNATHIAIIFLEHSWLLEDDMRNISRIVQQQHSQVKIFVVVIAVTYATEPIYLIDTLLTPDPDKVLFYDILFPAMCRQCLESWFALEHSDGADALSCYHLMDNNTTQINWVQATRVCQHGHLVTVETTEELHFLQTMLYQYVNERLMNNNHFNDSHQLVTHIYIGLNRNLTGPMKSFHWSLDNGRRTRPLVINNWLHGRPSGGYTSACAVWQFLRYDNRERTNVSSEGAQFVEGWADVRCREKLSALVLCEMVFPRRLEDKNILNINPATHSSFYNALNKSGFMRSGDNIVSVSNYIISHKNAKIKNEMDDDFPLFDCGEDASYPRYISYLNVCDNKDHCSNRRDETSCVPDSPREPSEENEQFLMRDCKGVFCCDGSCLPEQHVNDGQIDCAICEFGTENNVNDETLILNKYLKRNETCAFICGDDKCVHFSELNNGHDDCGGGEGPLDETIGKLETAETCYNILGHGIWAPRCVYVKDRYGVVLGCRDMSHLNDCAAFECSEGYFKCPNAYCIPHHYVLDGKVDCPTEVEEQLLNIGSCSGNFACWNSRICLHPDLVCNGHPECPHGDDEDCYTRCPDGLRCVSGTITVPDYDTDSYLNAYVEDSKTKYLDLSGIGIERLCNRLGFNLHKLLIIIVSKCNIRHADSLAAGVKNTIQKLDASHNLIRTFSAIEYQYGSFIYIRHLNLSYNYELTVMENTVFKYLEVIDLSHTSVSYLDESFLVCLPNLKHLNMSHTFITDYHKHVFPSRYVLETLDLRGTSMSDFKEQSFLDLSINQHLYTDNFEICCPHVKGVNIPYYTCHAPVDVISSCFDLVGENIQRVFLWVVAALAVLGNTTVIVYRVIWDRSVLRTGYGLFVTNLGISNLIMGVYLFIIAGADYYYRGSYVLHDKSWRESVVCRISGFFATISIETSTFFCFLITLDRFLVMKFPIDQIQLSHIIKIIALLLSWIIGFLLALIPVGLEFEIFSSDAMCVGLPLTRTRYQGWGYSFGVFIVLNCVMFLIIACGQIAIYRAMSLTRIASSNLSSRNYRPEDILVAKQLSLVAISSFMSFFPVGILGLLSLGEQDISNESYSWISIVVLPINSAANPVLYTIPALIDKWDKFKHGGSRH